MSKKVALITGVTGQDGSYLAEFLLEKGYEVHGIKRRSSLFNTQRVDHIYQDPHIKDPKFYLHYGDLTDSSNLTRILSETKPDEVYNLGAMSHVAVSFESPEYTADVDAIGTLRLLEAMRFLGMEKTLAFLSGFDFGVVRTGAGNTAKRNHTVLPALTLCSRQTLCLLDYGQLPRSLRHVCL